jgi:hypothetical protein
MFDFFLFFVFVVFKMETWDSDLLAGPDDANLGLSARLLSFWYGSFPFMFVCDFYYLQCVRAVLFGQFLISFKYWLCVSTLCWKILCVEFANNVEFVRLKAQAHKLI